MVIMGKKNKQNNTPTPSVSATEANSVFQQILENRRAASTAEAAPTSVVSPFNRKGTRWAKKEEPLVVHRNGSQEFSAEINVEGNDNVIYNGIISFDRTSTTFPDGRKTQKGTVVFGIPETKNERVPLEAVFSMFKLTRLGQKLIELSLVADGEIKRENCVVKITPNEKGYVVELYEGSEVWDKIYLSKCGEVNWFRVKIQNLSKMLSVAGEWTQGLKITKQKDPEIHVKSDRKPQDNDEED